MKNIILIDDTGTPRNIPEANLYQHLAGQDFILYGMSLPTILRLRAEYLKLGGCEPITDESIREIFSALAAMPNADIRRHTTTRNLNE